MIFLSMGRYCFFKFIHFVNFWKYAMGGNHIFDLTGSD